MKKSKTRNDISYIGVFTEHVNGTLGKDILNQHITLAFKPTEEQFKELLPLLGKNCAYKVIGYGNDGLNEGLHVQLQSENPYFGAKQQHITLSVDFIGKPVDTGKLQFSEKIPERIDVRNGEILCGKIGAFMLDRTIEYDVHAFIEFGDMRIQSIKDVAAQIAVDKYKMPVVAESIDSSKISYRVNYSEWKKVDKLDINTLDNINGIIDIKINDPKEPCLIHDVTNGLQIDNMIILVGENICWSNVDFAEEYVNLVHTSRHAITELQNEGQNVNDSANSEHEGNNNMKIVKIERD